FKNNTIMNNKYIHYYFIVMFVLISTYSVGITEIDYVDRIRYTASFNTAGQLSLSSFLEVYSEDHLFYIVTWLIAQIVSNVKIYYIILHFSFISILIKGIKSTYGNDVLVISLFLYL